MCIHLLQMQQDVLDKSSASISAKLAKAGYGLGQQCKIPRVTGIKGIHNLMQTLSTNCSRLSQKGSLSHGTGYWDAPSNNLIVYLQPLRYSCILFFTSPCFLGSFIKNSGCTKILVSVSALGGGYPNKGRHPLYKSVCMCIGIYHSYIFDYWNEENITFICIFLSKSVVKTTKMA